MKTSENNNTCYFTLNSNEFTKTRHIQSICILMSVFNYTQEQAEQILLLTDYKGSYTFKKFSILEINDMIDIELILVLTGLSCSISYLGKKSYKQK